MPIKVVAIVAVTAGKEGEFARAAEACAAASRAEPGVVRYDLWREAAGDRRFVFDELYVDDAAVARHMASAHFTAFASAVGSLVDGPPDIIATAAVDVAGGA